MCFTIVHTSHLWDNPGICTDGASSIGCFGGSSGSVGRPAACLETSTEESWCHDSHEPHQLFGSDCSHYDHLHPDDDFNVWIHTQSGVRISGSVIRKDLP